MSPSCVIRGVVGCGGVALIAAEGCLSKVQRLTGQLCSELPPLLPHPLPLETLAHARQELKRVSIGAEVLLEISFDTWR